MDDLQNFNWFDFNLADKLDGGEEVEWFIEESEKLFIELGLNTQAMQFIRFLALKGVR